MTPLPSLAADLVAIVVLGFVVYYPRHRRRDLLVAFLGVNAGVVAVTLALVDSDATIGLGLGLFGVLSIIRLRSLELGQHEVAYYFGALALGLLGGLGSLSVPLTVGLMGLVVGVIAFADSPRLLSRDRQGLVLLDGAFTDDAELRDALGRTVTGTVRKYVVARVDLVNDTTLVDVRWSVPRAPAPASGADASAASPGASSPATPLPLAEGVR